MTGESVKMTERIVLGKEKSLDHQKKLPWSFLKKCCFAYMSVFMLLLFFKRPTETAEWVERGLSVCTQRLIPSLFPFMVVSALLLSSGVGEWLGKIFAKPFGALFGVGSQGAAALLLGWLCGFPIGARSASSLYRDGKISDAEFERIVCISGTPSPAFLINVAGASMLGDRKKGVALYIICLLSCVTVGIFMKRICGAGREYEAPSRNTRKIGSIAQIFTRAVTDSTTGMLCVCGFVVFFSAFVGALDGYITSVIGKTAAADAVFGFFEITVGLSRITSSSMSAGVVFVMCAMASAWSGLSVHLQVISLCSETVFPISKYFLANLAKAAVGAILALACLPILHIL